MNSDVNLDVTLRNDVILSDNKYDFRITDFEVSSNEYKHIPKAYEILIVMGGSGTLQLGNTVHSVSKGFLFFFHDGDVYKICAPKESLFIKVIGFSNTFYCPFNERAVSFFDIPHSKRKIYTKIEPAEFEHFQYVLSVLNQHSMFLSTYNRFSIITILNFILLHYMVITDGSITDTDYQDDVGKALRYIYDKFRLSDFSISEMANQLHFTPTYLSKLFKKEVGMSMQLYILNLRLEFAADLLMGCSLSINEIAAESGFNTASYFIKQFKKKYGVTPKKYVLQHENNEN